MKFKRGKRIKQTERATKALMDKEQTNLKEVKKDG
jgi:hypothetical protein